MTVITCLRSTLLLSDSRDTPLRPKEDAELRLHVQTCPRCRVASTQFGRLFEALDELLSRPLPEP